MAEATLSWLRWCWIKWEQTFSYFGELIAFFSFLHWLWCSLLMAYQGVFTCCCPSCQRHIHCPSSQGRVDRKVSQWASLTSSLLTHDKHHGKNVGVFYSPEMYGDSDTKLGTVVSIWLLLPMVSRIVLAVFQGKENHLLQTWNSY